MPTQVQRRPSEPLPVPPRGGVGADKYHDHASAARAQQQQQLQHREALRLALGSILTPKRPPITPTSRSSSGTSSPAYPFGAASGTHTPVGTPPTSSYYPLAHGPNSSEYLHPHHAYQHHGHPLPPSKLGRSSSASNSPSESAQPSAPSSNHPSPRPGMVDDPTKSSAGPPPLPLDIEPLPPAIQPHDVSSTAPASPETARPIRPPITPLHPSSKSSDGAGSGSGDGPMAAGSESATHSASGTPRAKFLETLQSKSAWDALIHGSFS